MERVFIISNQTISKNSSISYKIYGNIRHISYNFYSNKNNIRFEDVFFVTKAPGDTQMYDGSINLDYYLNTDFSKSCIFGEMYSVKGAMFDNEIAINDVIKQGIGMFDIVGFTRGYNFGYNERDYSIEKYDTGNEIDISEKITAELIIYKNVFFDQMKVYETEARGSTINGKVLKVKLNRDNCSKYYELVNASLVDKRMGKDKYLESIDTSDTIIEYDTFGLDLGKHMNKGEIDQYLVQLGRKDTEVDSPDITTVGSRDKQWSGKDTAVYIGQRSKGQVYSGSYLSLNVNSKKLNESTDMKWRVSKVDSSVDSILNSLSGEKFNKELNNFRNDLDFINKKDISTDYNILKYNSAYLKSKIITPNFGDLFTGKVLKDIPTEDSAFIISKKAHGIYSFDMSWVGKPNTNVKYDEEVWIGRGVGDREASFNDLISVSNLIKEGRIYNTFTLGTFMKHGYFTNNMFANKTIKDGFFSNSLFVNKNRKDGFFDKVVFLNKYSKGIISDEIINVSKDSSEIYDDCVIHLGKDAGKVYTDDTHLLVGKNSKGYMSTDGMYLDKRSLDIYTDSTIVCKKEYVGIYDLLDTYYSLFKDSKGIYSSDVIHIDEHSKGIYTDETFTVDKGNHGIYGQEIIDLFKYSAPIVLKEGVIKPAKDNIKNAMINFDDLSASTPIKHADLDPPLFVTVIPGHGDDEYEVKTLGLVDELILPHKDYKYSDYTKDLFNSDGSLNNLYVKSYDSATQEYTIKFPLEHPLEIYADVARDYADVDVGVIKDMISRLEYVWKKSIFKLAGMNSHDGIKFVLKELYKYVQRCDLENEEGITYQQLRILQMIRWYSEMAILNNCDYILKFNTREIFVDFVDKDYKDLTPYVIEDNLHISDDYVIEAIDKNNIPFVPGNTLRGKSTLTINNHNKTSAHPMKINFDLYITNATVSIFNIESGVNVKRTYSSGLHNIYLPVEEQMIIELEFPIGSVNPDISITDLYATDIIDNKYTITYKGVFSHTNKTIDDLLVYMNIFGAIPSTEMHKIEKVYPLSITIEKMHEYYELHHNQKLKGKRLITKK